MSTRPEHPHSHRIPTVFSMANVRATPYQAPTTPSSSPTPPQRAGCCCPAFFVCHLALLLKRRFPSSCGHLRRPAGCAMRSKSRLHDRVWIAARTCAPGACNDCHIENGGGPMNQSSARIGCPDRGPANPLPQHCTAACGNIFSARIDGCGTPNRIAPGCTTIVCPMGHWGLTACRSC